jgi:hypothetical protein
MAIGEGKYDELCGQARDGAEAAGAALLIIGGMRGSGFSVQMPPDLALLLPVMLRDMADQIEADLRKRMQ